MTRAACGPGSLGDTFAGQLGGTATIHFAQDTNRYLTLVFDNGTMQFERAWGWPEPNRGGGAVTSPASHTTRHAGPLRGVSPSRQRLIPSVETVEPSLVEAFVGEGPGQRGTTRGAPVPRPGERSPPCEGGINPCPSELLGAVAGCLPELPLVAPQSPPNPFVQVLEH